MTASPELADEQVLGNYLSLQRPTLCPEISLYLVHGRVDLESRCEALMQGDYAPYWAFCWSAGQALARFILDHPEHVRDKLVVDFGSGSGVVAIAAAMAGAREVIAVDKDRRALSACVQNAAQNGVHVSTREGLCDTWQVLLAADVLYEPGMRSLLLSHTRPGRTVLVSCPDRPGNPRMSDLPELARYDARCLPDVDQPVRQASIHPLNVSPEIDLHR